MAAPTPPATPTRPRRLAALTAIAATLVTGCSSKILDPTPPTIPSATAAVSPPTSVPPAGRVIPLPGRPGAVLHDAKTSLLAVLTPGPESTLTVLAPGRPPRVVPLPTATTAITGDGTGTVWAATRGGVITVDLASATATPIAVAGEADTEFTAIARRADGRLVLGSATGAFYLLDTDFTVRHRKASFARVDAIVTLGEVSVVLDRGQTSVTALDADGETMQALRAGMGATSIAADAADRVLVTDTRGGQLLVFTVDPLIERQAYPVPESPYGVTGSRTLVWVSQTASNTVVGYDLSTGIPVEKVRYPTVQQPDSLAYDETSGTLYVMSGAGAGVQAIPRADGRR
ncbi:MAG TPA: hypothetical protein PKK01_13130 [Mycobacterium sp.]|nr:hypothetical protein [Mycobacterium sp.]